MAGLRLWLLLFIFGVIECDRTVVQEFSCPLARIKGECSTIKRGVYHWIRHTYIKIGSKCYDYGSWGFARAQDCDSKALECCVNDNRLESTIYSKCADRVQDFNDFWTAQDTDYNTLTHNCQDYTHAVIRFLRRCRELDFEYR